MLSELEERVTGKIKKAEWWPATPATPSKRLERAQPILRLNGIEFERRKGGASGRRTIYLERVPQKEVEACLTDVRFRGHSGHTSRPGKTSANSHQRTFGALLSRLGNEGNVILL